MTQDTRPPVGSTGTLHIAPGTEVTIDPRKFSIWYNHKTDLVHITPAPAETRVSCYRGVAGVGGKYGTCIKRPDGSIDWQSWRAEA